MVSSVVLPEFMEKVCSQYRRLDKALRIEYIPYPNFTACMEDLNNLKYDIIETFTLDGLCPAGIHFDYLSDVRSWCIMSDSHPLSHKALITPEDLEGYRLVFPDYGQPLMRYFQMYIEITGKHVTVDYVANDRYQYMDELNKDGILLVNEDIANSFPGIASAPLAFDTHVQHGFAYREAMYELYKPFFNIAHQLSDGKPA